MEADTKPRIQLRVDEFDRLMRQRGNLTDEEAGRSIGVAGTTIRRIKTGEATVGADFVSKTLLYLNLPRQAVKFEHLFEVTA